MAISIFFKLFEACLALLIRNLQNLSNVKQISANKRAFKNTVKEKVYLLKSNYLEYSYSGNRHTLKV